MLIIRHNNMDCPFFFMGSPCGATFALIYDLFNYAHPSNHYHRYYRRREIEKEWQLLTDIMIESHYNVEWPEVSRMANYLDIVLLC